MSPRNPCVDGPPRGTMKQPPAAFYRAAGVWRVPVRPGESGAGISQFPSKETNMSVAAHVLNRAGVATMALVALTLILLAPGAIAQDQPAQPAQGQGQDG